MKRILYLIAIISCLSSSGAATNEALATCDTLTLKAAPSFRVGAGSNDVTAVITGDLNNDGRPDVVTANGSSNTVSVLLGAGQSFSPAINFPVGAGRPFSVAVGDFNEDGKADVVTGNVSTDNLSILSGDGAGGLAAATLVSGVSEPIFVLTADVNGDGNLDLAVASSDTASVRLLLGNGAGGFALSGSFAVGINPHALAAADFNLDGNLDLAVVNLGSNNISVLAGDGAGGFTLAGAAAVGTTPVHLATADFNGDGKADLAVANLNSFSVSVLIGIGDGRFGPVTNLSVGSPVNSVTVGDFNHDGSADLAAGTNTAGVSVRLGDGAGGFGAARSFRPGFGPLFVSLTDFNLDGSDDLVVVSATSDTLVPLAGDGAGNFAHTPFQTGAGNAISVALADFNGDGDPDAVTANENLDSVSVRLGTGTGTFGDPTDFPVGTRPFYVSVGDFNNDGRADLVVANFFGAALSVLLGDGAGGFGPAASITLGLFNPTFVAVSDLNQDGKADLIAVRTNAHVVTVLLGDGAGGFGSPANFNTAPNPQAVAVGDFNSDGKPDLAVADNSFSILLGDGAGGFGAPLNTNFGDNTGPSDIVARDFNGDGKLDLAIANEFTNNVSVLLGDGTAKFAPRVNFPVGSRPVALQVGDFNGDGLHDLVTGNSFSQNLTVLRGDGAGGFGAATHWSLPTLPAAVAVGDLDGDDRADLTAVGMDALAALLNTCGDTTPAPDARLSVNDVAVMEADAGTVNAVFTVSLAAPSTQVVTTRFVASGGSAERGRDFQAVSGTLTFAPGVTTQTVTVPVVGDAADEFDEVFSLNLFEPANALITRRRGAGTITDNDLPPALSVGNLSAPEGQSNNAFGLPVTLSQASGKLVTVAHSTADGTAAAGVDYVGGSGTLVLPAGTASGVISVGVVGDSINEPDETFFVDLGDPVNSSLAVARGVATIINDDTTEVQFGDASFAAAEGGVAVNVVVGRTGDTSGESFVNYGTADGSASERQDYTAAFGRLRFGPGDTLQSFRVIITDDRFNDDAESFGLRLTGPAGAELGALAEATVTITDNDAADGPSPVKDATFDTAFFVRQHYHDFLNREPDAAGLQFWRGEIESCGADQQCRVVKSVNVSAAFFLSIEFQETGYLAYRTHKAAFGDATSPNVPGTVPVIRLREFLADAQAIGQGVQVGVGDWAAQLEANKQTYFLEFVRRQLFMTEFPLSLTAEQFVDRLNQRAGGVLSAAARSQLVAALGESPADAPQRASVLRAVAEDADLRQRETNRAFVLMQYYGYLRRNPDDPSDTDFRGWKFWLDKLDEHGGNFVTAEMVRAFISSIEYGQRFGQ